MPTTAQRIAVIRDFPEQLEQLTARLTTRQLTTAFNAPEWTVAQNIHHCADSHMNCFIRFKLGLTEEHPTIKPYDQDTWALLPDANNGEVAASLAILQGVHQRWVVLLNNITDWTRTVYHPGMQKTLSLDDLLTIYSEHCTDHLQQIRDVIAKMI